MSNIILLALDSADLSQEQHQRIQALLPDRQLVVTEQREEVEPLLDQVEVAAGHFPVQWITKAPNLRWYQQWGAGTDWLLRHPEVAARDFILTNASGVHAIPISEHILAYLLAFARSLPEALRAQDRKEWKRDMRAFELAGKTMLLVGVGAIGRRTAHIAHALGMHVIGVRRDPSKGHTAIERMVGPDALQEVLPETDFLVLTVPLTRETRGMIDQHAFDRMKPGSYLINIGRGGTVDEPALIEALRNGKIAGAGLDVFATEPLPPDSPLWEMENVIITAHYSGNTPLYDERALDIFLYNLECYAHGKPMRNVVDKQRGY